MLDEKAAQSITPVYASAPIKANRSVLTLCGVSLELLWPGNGHFPGDAVLWLPSKQVVFTGDFVFNDRILGIHPFTPLVELCLGQRIDARLLERVLRCQHHE